MESVGKSSNIRHWRAGSASHVFRAECQVEAQAMAGLIQATIKMANTMRCLRCLGLMIMVCGAIRMRPFLGMAILKKRRIPGPETAAGFYCQVDRICSG
ncbi:MAG: hypothetical protein ABR512_06505, partial [Desulfopila sp.]